MSPGRFWDHPSYLGAEQQAEAGAVGLGPIQLTPKPGGATRVDCVLIVKVWRPFLPKLYTGPRGRVVESVGQG